MKNKSFKIFNIIVLIVIIFPLTINAKSGCCSHHGGVAGCHSSGKQLCNDGTLSPSCTCTPQVTYVYGCTDSDAKNYNPKANKNDGSCKYYVYGCTDETAKNYNSKAEKDNDTCEYYVYGCMDEEAKNYNSNAEKDDGSCEYYKYGCTNKDAKNYDKDAEKDDGSCQYYKYGCTDKKAINYDETAEKDDDSCEYKTISQETSKENQPDPVEEDSSGIGSLLTLGGIGTAVYYMKKKK